MTRVFFDASVFLASLHSPSGGSSEVFRYAVVGAMEALVSEDVIEEVARNIQGVKNELVAAWLKNIATIPFTSVSVTKEEVEWAADFTDEKDAHIVAAAEKAGVDFLVTLDKRHLLDKKEAIEPNISFRIVRPEDLLEVIRGEFS